MTTDKFKWVVIENIATLISASVVIVGVYYFSRSFHAFWGLVILANLNFVKSADPK